MIKCDNCDSVAENPVENEDGSITYFCANEECKIQGVPVKEGSKILDQEVECGHENYDADCYVCHMKFADKILEIDSKQES